MYVRVKLPKDMRRSVVDPLIVLYLLNIHFSKLFCRYEFSTGCMFPLGDNREQKETFKTIYLLST